MMTHSTRSDIELSLSRSRRKVNNTLYLSVIIVLLVSQMFLVVSFVELRQDYQNVRTERDFWVLRNREVQVEETKLEDLYVSLRQEHGNLISDYEELSKEHDVLRDEAVTPPYILLSGREATLVWRRRDGNVTSWMVPMDSYRAQILTKKPERYLIMKDSKGVVHKAMDFRPFVSPLPFKDFAPDLYESAGSNENFVYEVWSLAVQLSAYTPDIGETPRWPLETLVEGGGDCEDVSILISSILLASGEMEEVGFVYLDAENPGDLENLNHIIVYVKAGEYEALVDGTSRTMDPFMGNVDGFYYPL